MGHPLIFLVTRTLFNGVKRAVTSGRRLIALIFFTGYYLLFFLHPFQPQSDSFGRMHPRPYLDLPPMPSIQAAVFIGFVVLSGFMAVSALNYRGGFRPADVDVLFATPVNPRDVLILRMVRDYLFTLMVPLLIAVVSYRSTSVGFQTLFRGFPQLGGYTFRAAAAAWLLIALAWVCIGYALSLFINRTDLDSDRNRKWIVWIGIGSLTAVAVYAALRIRIDPSWATVVSLTGNPVVNVVFLTAYSGTQIVMAPLTGHLWTAGIGIAILAGMSAAGFRLAMEQVGWMYDQAAAKGFAVMDLAMLRRRGDTYALLADQASRGKLRAAPLSLRVSRITVTGALALPWREAVLYARGSAWQGFLFVPLAMLAIDMPIYALQTVPASEAGITCLALTGVLVYSLSMSGQSGFIELLRRVDLQKPLPFSASTIVFWEVVSKVIPVAVSLAPAGVLAIVLRPAIWTYAASAMIGAPFLGLEIVSTVLLITLLLPDIEDPSQRGFRQMMILLATLIVSIPGIGILVVLVLTRVSWIVLILLFAVVNLAASVAICTVAGVQYAAYNPSE